MTKFCLNKLKSSLCRVKRRFDILNRFGVDHDSRMWRTDKQTSEALLTNRAKWSKRETTACSKHRFCSTLFTFFRRPPDNNREVLPFYRCPFIYSFVRSSDVCRKTFYYAAVLFFTGLKLSAATKRPRIKCMYQRFRRRPFIHCVAIALFLF